MYKTTMSSNPQTTGDQKCACCGLYGSPSTWYWYNSKQYCPICINIKLEENTKQHKCIGIGAGLDWIRFKF